VLGALSGSSRRADDREAAVVQQGLKRKGKQAQMSAESSTIKVTLPSVCYCDRPVLR
jgi:hypothetical protein